MLAVSYFAIQNSRMQTYIAHYLTNELSKQLNADVKISKVDVKFFKRVTLHDILLEDQKDDTLFYAKRLDAKISKFNYKQRNIDIDVATLKNSIFKIQKDRSNNFNFDFLIKKDSTSNPLEWIIRSDQFKFSESNIIYKYYDKTVNNYKTTEVKDFNFSIDEFIFKEELIEFQLNKLNLENREFYNIKDLSTHLIVFKDSVIISDFNVETEQSIVKNTNISFKSIPNKNLLESIDNINIDIERSVIDLDELSVLVPALKGMNEKISIRGNISGNLNNLKGKSVEIRTGNVTYLDLQFYLNDLLSKNMYIFLDINKLRTSIKDISSIRLPNKSKNRYIKFPTRLNRNDIITFKGNFSGFINDFVTYGVFNTKQGVIKTDIAVTPLNKTTAKYRGNLSTNQFQLGDLFNMTNIGKITFNGDINGSFNNKTKVAVGLLNGKVDQFEIDQYNYQNIVINGKIDRKNYSGLIKVVDPNLQLDFMGDINLNNAIPNFDFQLDLAKANIGELKFVEKFPNSSVNFKAYANFKGNNIDNLLGVIKLDSGLYTNSYGTIKLEKITLQSSPNYPLNTISLISPFVDASIKGDYHLETILQDLKYIANDYIPSLKFDIDGERGTNKFDYFIEFKDLDQLTNVLYPKIQVNTPFNLKGSINSLEKSLIVESTISKINYNNIIAKDINIDNKPVDDLFFSNISISSLQYSDQLELNNINLKSLIQDDNINSKLVWGDKKKSNIIAKTNFARRDNHITPLISIDTETSKIYVGDTLWQIAPTQIEIDTTLITVENFKIFNRDQALMVDGKISENKVDSLVAYFENFDIGDIEKGFDNKFTTNGRLSGTIGLINAYTDEIIYSDLVLNDFTFNKKPIGTISIKNNWDNLKSIVNSEISVINNGESKLFAKGWIQPKEKKIQYNATTNDFPLVLLESVVKSGVSNFNGYANGDLEVSGSLNDIHWDGILFVDNGSIDVDFTQVEYSFSDSIYFKKDSILFKNIIVTDSQNNYGVLEGEVDHKNFRNFHYKFDVSTSKLLALNTTSSNNSSFYGTVFSSGNFYIDGDKRGVNIDAYATTLLGTSVYISTISNDGVDNYDFIEFVKPENSPETASYQRVKTKGANVNLNINATSDAKVQLIYSPQIGDMIKAQGNGYLTFKINRLGKMSLIGDYTIERGDYLFTLQNVINKRFRIENGSSINWTGDMLKANIDLAAIYSLKASTGDLPINMLGISDGKFSQNARIPVDATIHLGGLLINPNIKFEMNFPNADSRTVDILKQYINSEEELNKQILSLIVLGKFNNPDNYQSSPYEGVLEQTTSELLSNKLSNWLSKLDNNWDFGFNYRPGNQISDDEIQVALSTQLFNNRVTINGNVGNSVNQYTGKDTQELVGDFEVFVKLTPKGKLQFKAYNRYNNDYFYETAPYTQGIGLLYKEEYNTWQELLFKIKKIFKHKK